MVKRRTYPANVDFTMVKRRTFRTNGAKSTIKRRIFPGPIGQCLLFHGKMTHFSCQWRHNLGNNHIFHARRGGARSGHTTVIQQCKHAVRAVPCQYPPIRTRSRASGDPARPRREPRPARVSARPRREPRPARVSAGKESFQRTGALRALEAPNAPTPGGRSRAERQRSNLRATSETSIGILALITSLGLSKIVPSRGSRRFSVRLPSIIVVFRQS